MAQAAEPGRNQNSTCTTKRTLLDLLFVIRLFVLSSGLWILIGCAPTPNQSTDEIESAQTSSGPRPDDAAVAATTAILELMRRDAKLFEWADPNRLAEIPVTRVEESRIHRVDLQLMCGINGTTRTRAGHFTGASVMFPKMESG